MVVSTTKTYRAGIKPYVTQWTRGQNFHAVLSGCMTTENAGDISYSEEKSCAGTQCLADSQHDRNYAALHFLFGTTHAVPVQYTHCHNINGTFDRQVHRLIHEDLEHAICDPAIQWQDPIAGGGGKTLSAHFLNSNCGAFATVYY